MHTKFKSLFKGQDPSVRLFKQRLTNRSAEEVNQYYLHAYNLGFFKWQEQTTAYKLFLKNLIQNDWQRFLDFTHGSVLAELRYSFADPILAARVLALMEKDKQQRSSSNHLGFSFLMGFKSTVQVKTLGKIIRFRTFMPEELQNIKGKAIIDTGEKK